MFEAVSSQDFLYVDLARDMEEERRVWEDAAEDLDILRSESQVKLFQGGARQFPIPFNFEDSDS
jgi:hypothetical protein